MTASYFAPTGGHPSRDQLLMDRAVLTQACAVISNGTMRDIVTSALPFQSGTRLWVIARPLSGFAETVSHDLMEVAAAGGSDRSDTDTNAQAVPFVTHGTATRTVGDAAHTLDAGGYAYIPAGIGWTLHNAGATPLRFHWVRKAYVAVPGLDTPEAFVTNEVDIARAVMPGTDGKWATTRFVDPIDVRRDMHVNIVAFAPGAVIPFLETHPVEHGLYVPEGKAVYRLNSDWVGVEAGDYIWLRAFCPQACYAGGPKRFRYLLYRDVNLHMPLHPPR